MQIIKILTINFDKEIKYFLTIRNCISLNKSLNKYLRILAYIVIITLYILVQYEKNERKNINNRKKNGG